MVAAADRLAAQRARQDAYAAANPDVCNPIEELLAATDWAGDAWHRSRRDAAQASADHAVKSQALAAEPPPF